MFCDGKCKSEKETEEGTVIKKCGLHVEVIWKEEVTGKTRTEDGCTFFNIMTSLHRQEQANIRIQAAIESQRNEACNWSAEVAKTVATGMLGLINVVEGNREKVMKAVKRLKDLESIKNLEEKNKDVQRKRTEIEA